jgi:NADH dehydrogenase/NADH:ubiquinone oxidoreductase subunit G
MAAIFVCIGVCPTGALIFKGKCEMRQAGSWDEPEQTITTTICPYCGAGCNLELHAGQPDREGDLAPRP